MRVGPACLPFYYMQRNFTNQLVTALGRYQHNIIYIHLIYLKFYKIIFAGWGTTSFGGPKSEVLMKVNLHVITQKKCNQKYSNITSNQICTYDEGKDACQV